MMQLQRKGQQLFGTHARGPLETVFRHMDFKPLVLFGSFWEMSTNIKEYIKLAVDYGAEHLRWTMVASTVEAVKMALRRRYMSKLSKLTGED
jgi:hypothetical protein